MSRRLVILGASARAAAGSARRAGFTPWSADLFADVDLQRLGTAVRVSDYPQGLIRAVATAPRADWLYTGGLENHPELVDRIAARRRLLGNRGAILRAVRDPVTLAETFGRAGIAAPEVVRDAPRSQRGASSNHNQPRPLPYAYPCLLFHLLEELPQGQGYNLL